jgi:hypothetical protein
MQLLTQAVLASRGQNQTLSYQQVLTPSTTHNVLAPRPPTTLGAQRWLYYLEETSYNDISISYSRDH